MTRLVRAFLVVWLAWVTTTASAAPLLSDRNPVNARLVAEVLTIQPGKPFTAALELDHYEHWHTYWHHSQTGYATTLKWDLPEGWQAGELQWPVPLAMDFGGLVEFVYEGRVLLPVEITPPADLPVGQKVTLRAKAGWLMCKETCIPGQADLELILPVAAQSMTSLPLAERFNETRAHLPQPAEGTVHAWRSGDTVHLWVQGDTLPGELYYFDGQAFLVPTLSVDATPAVPSGRHLKFTVDPAGVGYVDRLQGVLALGNGQSVGQLGWAIDVPLEAKAPAGLQGVVGKAESAKVALLPLLGIGFLGGLILNLMPCVFPVLGLKVLGFVNQAGEERGKVVLHGLVFTLGVLLSFWVLVGVLLALRAGGATDLGWGYQLQTPVFGYFLAVFLFAFGLNLSGVFEIGQQATAVGQGLANQGGLRGSFFSGVLATVVATPCSAPLLGTALASALALPTLAAFAVFTAIGLGLSAPYLLLSANPDWVKVLPRPGAWMETFKQAMAFGLYAAAGWLVWNLVGQLTAEKGFSDQALLWVILSLVGVAVGLWIFGRYTGFERSKKQRYTAYGLSALFVVGSLAAAYPRPSVIHWQAWEPGLPEKLAAEGKTVYVDFTARWCLTCQTNKAAVFGSGEVQREFVERGIVTLKADWTNQDPAITQALASFDRVAVPFNVIYAPGLPEPVELPEVLTPSLVIEKLESLPAR